jgi:rhamnosyltransferase
VGVTWLAPLIVDLEADPSLAGVCSRVSPYPDADLLTGRDVTRDLSASPMRRRIQIEDWAAYRALTPDERRTFVNFHTVSAAVNAEAWRCTPFRAVCTLGEDLLWACEVVESGWALLHEPASVVHHSHNYSLSELFSRNVDDGIANRDIIGRTLTREEVMAMVRAMVADDWAYLRQTAGLSGKELERWQLEAALRRAAQMAGQWLGLNHDDLPQATALYFSGIAAPRSPRGSGCESSS